MSSAPQAAPAPATPRSHAGEHVTALPCRGQHVAALPWRRLPATAWLALTTTLALAGTLVLALNAPTADPADVAEAPAAATTPATAALAAGLPDRSAAHAAALAQFSRAVAGDNGAVDAALAQWRALMAAVPAQPVWRAYAGAATSLQARNTLLPCKKLTYADDGLALIDKALSQLNPVHDRQLVDGVPVSLLVRFTAQGTFNALPAMFNRGDRGHRLMDGLLKSPLLAAAPLAFRGAVWLRAADDAARAQRTEDARQWLHKLAASGAPQAGAAQARLKVL